MITESTTSQSVCPSVSMSSLISPGHGEAEELRRQQLAIEREVSNHHLLTYSILSSKHDQDACATDSETSLTVVSIIIIV